MPIYTRQYQTLPSLPGRGPLPPLVSVVVPLDRTNLITNPSIELATTGYTAVGGSIARSAADQYHGTYSLAITPSAGTNSDGAFYGTVSLTTGTPYAYSLKFRATGTGIGKTYALSVATTGGVDVHVTQFVATGRWQWIKGVYGETSSTTRRIYIRKVNHSAASVFYTDGWQVESCADGILDATTYIDGDQQGLLVGQQPAPYLWTGTPHASASTRSALTRAGGYVVNLSFFNFLLAGIVGLGMAVPNNVSISYTILDGARFQRTQKPPRTIALAGRFQANNVFELMQSQSDLRQVLDRDYAAVQQPLVLTVEPQDECGSVIGDFAQVQCLYAGGLEGNDGNYPAEDVAPTFTMYLPFLIGGDGGAALTAQQTITNANAIAQRLPSGTWQALTTGLSGGVTTVFALAYGRDGTLWVGGIFTTAGGVASEGIARWDGSAWSTPVAGVSAGGFVNALAVMPNGDIIAAGNFTTIGGVAAVDIARWDGSAWNALGTGSNSSVAALAVGQDGTLYATGAFTLMGGVANTVRIAKWDGSVWTPLGTGLSGTGNALAILPDGRLAVGGAFATANGVTVNFVAIWNGTTFLAMAGGMDNSPSALLVGPNGVLYAAGAFTVAGGVAALRMATWNGSSWSQVGSGLSGTANVLARDVNGDILVGGQFNQAGGITMPDRVARWTGSAFLPLDIDLPSTATVTAIAVSPAGALSLGYNTTGSATAAVPITMTNDGPSIVYPRLVIKGPSSGTARIWQLVNTTTGVGVWFNYTIAAGETAIINFDPTNPSAISDAQGDISSTILPGSGALYLAPGVNTLSFFAASSTVTATLSWPTRYNGMADLVN